MTLTLVNGPAVEPVSPAEAKDHLRLDSGIEDAYLGALITAARQACETFTGRSLVTQSWKLTLDRWPQNYDHDVWWDGTRQGSFDLVASVKRTLDVPRGPLQSVTSLTVFGSDGDSTLIDPSVYIVAPGLDGRIALKAGQVWPLVTAPVGAVEIVFVAGFGASWNDVPAALRHGMLLLAAQLYENREAFAEQDRLPNAVLSLWRPWRKVRL